MISRYLTFFSLLVLMASAAHAQDATQANKKLTIRNVCAKEIKTFCDGVQWGKGRMVACLNQHVQDLSVSCQGILMVKQKEKASAAAPAAVPVPSTPTPTIPPTVAPADIPQTSTPTFVTPPAPQQ